MIDVKNMAGEIYFDNTFNQLIRTNPDGKTEAFDDPILQVNRQRQQLVEWLKFKKIINLPVETLVVSANSSTIIRAENRDIHRKVIRKDSILIKIAEFKEKYEKNIYYIARRTYTIYPKYFGKLWNIPYHPLNRSIPPYGETIKKVDLPYMFAFFP
ncbi:nuclease-related domain-containing protein [Peribacillus simplex]|uniref:nuclease-related domain-containing protein n=1 Tax=Peribacillus simplex TaxID=1478 RepID=UPI0028159C7E|nr:nuclease-related domain-containing protein [Peribacillus simplex]